MKSLAIFVRRRHKPTGRLNRAYGTKSPDEQGTQWGRGDSRPLVCVDGFTRMKVDPVGRASPEHKDQSHKILWAPAWCWGSECVWQRHHSPRALITSVHQWIGKTNSWWADPNENQKSVQITFGKLSGWESHRQSPVSSCVCSLFARQGHRFHYNLRPKTLRRHK